MNCETCEHRKLEYVQFESFYYCKKTNTLLCYTMIRDRWLKWKRLKDENDQLLIPRSELDLLSLHFKAIPTNPLKETPKDCPL